MARKVLLDGTSASVSGTSWGYSYNSGTLTIGKYIPKERIVLITDITTNKVVYNFSDPSLIASISPVINSDQTEQTTIVLNSNVTSGISTNDRFQIVIDEDSTIITPAETLMDPTNKMRVSTPQALIDTDFEYGAQYSKWESTNLINQHQAAYPTATAIPVNTTTPTTMSVSQNTKLVTVTVANGHGLQIGQPVTIIDSLWSPANGNFFVMPFNFSTTVFTYEARTINPNTTTAIFDANKTSIYPGAFYSQAPIGTVSIATAYNATTGAVELQTTVPHGLALGNEIALVGFTGLTLANTSFGNGNYLVTSVTSPFKFKVTLPAQGTGTLSTTTTAALTASSASVSPTVLVPVTSTTNVVVGSTITGTGIPTGTIITAINTTTNTLTLSQATTAALTTTASSYAIGAAVYPRPQGQVAHRPYDGGVIFSTNQISSNHQQIRQTRRYFRYQSGKAIQMSSGTILRPYANVDALRGSGTTVTVTTKERHNLTPGVAIVVSGSTDTAYNGTFTVASVLAWNQFTYTTSTTVTLPVAPLSTLVSVSGWSGATNRLGIFDTQNGIFFEYDGQKLYAVRRNSTTQLAGRISVDAGGTTVTATDNTYYPTSFSRQLIAGDFVVIRGMSYRVLEVVSDTQFSISPAYRGATNVVGGVLSKTIDTKIPQTSWNLDVCDGTGPSGYNLDLSKMQMFYMDFTWYGAGFIRWGVRGPKGNVIYVHKMQNNNVNGEAYMRSGNLPGRYESTTYGPTTAVTSTLSNSELNTITVADASLFPSSGTLLVRQVTALSTGTTPTVTESHEYINYTGKTGTTFTGLTREQAGNATTQSITASVGATSFTVGNASGIQVGQRIIEYSYPQRLPDNTYVTAINGTTISLSQAVSIANPIVTFAPMGTGSPATFTYNSNLPQTISAELAFPTFAPTISHWGTSVMMDGRYDDDKSLLFTYGQTSQTPLQGTQGVVSITGATTATNAAYTIQLSDVTQLTIGLFVAGSGVGTGAQIVSINTLTKTITVNVANSAAITGTQTIGFSANPIYSATFSSGGTTTVGTVTFTSTANLTVGMQLVQGTGQLPGAVISNISGTVVTFSNWIGNATSFGSTSNFSVQAAGTYYFTSQNNQKALFSIRIAPSVDNGVPANLGYRELTNRMQLILKALDITTSAPAQTQTQPINLLVQALLNGVPSSTTAWTNVVGGAAKPNSSLAMIADYSSVSGGATITNGEVTGGFFTSGTTSLDLSNVRDLGNSVIGGGGLYSNTNVFPDGPDTLTLVVTNLSPLPVNVSGRLSWTEAQA